MALNNRDHLIDKQIIDVNGRVTTVKVRPDDAHGLVQANAPFRMAPPASSGGLNAHQKQFIYDKQSKAASKMDWKSIKSDKESIESQLVAQFENEGMRFHSAPQFQPSRLEEDHAEMFANSGASIKVKAPLLQRLSGGPKEDKFVYTITNDGVHQVTKNDQQIDPVQEANNPAFKRLAAAVSGRSETIAKFNDLSQKWENRWPGVDPMDVYAGNYPSYPGA